MKIKDIEWIKVEKGGREIDIREVSVSIKSLLEGYVVSCINSQNYGCLTSYISDLWADLLSDEKNEAKT